MNPLSGGWVGFGLVTVACWVAILLVWLAWSRRRAASKVSAHPPTSESPTIVLVSFEERINFGRIALAVLGPPLVMFALRFLLRG